MSTISCCPRCRRMVTIPDIYDTSAVVRCPLCNSEYSLHEAIDAAPPELIPVAMPDFGSDQSSDKNKKGRGEVQTTKSLSYAALHGKRKPKNGLKILVEIILGGFFGLGIGYITLAWIAGERFDLPRPPQFSKPVLKFVLPDSIWKEGK
jgi:hypothetical protein